MKQKYFYTTLLFILMFSLGALAQENKGISTASKDPIEGLNIYPNPVSSGKIYVTTKSGLSKEVEIFDVLGKKVISASLNSKELNISDLTPGVYIIKVKEGESTATRKLIVK